MQELPKNIGMVLVDLAHFMGDDGKVSATCGAIGHAFWLDTDVAGSGVILVNQWVQ
jgi:hypothetical protein